jgi:hypothetical protein
VVVGKKGGKGIGGGKVSIHTEEKEKKEEKEAGQGPEACKIQALNMNVTRKSK